MSTGITSAMPSMRKRDSKRISVHARTSSSGNCCGSKCQRLRERMSRDLTASGVAAGILNHKDLGFFLNGWPGHRTQETYESRELSFTELIVSVYISLNNSA